MTGQRVNDKQKNEWASKRVNDKQKKDGIQKNAS
jgi:hypothetical protein